jgi:hypothetical protein
MLVKNAPKSGIPSVLPFPILYYNFSVNIASGKRSQSFPRHFWILKLPRLVALLRPVGKYLTYCTKQI